MAVAITTSTPQSHQLFVSGLFLSVLIEALGLFCVLLLKLFADASGVNFEPVINYGHTLHCMQLHCISK